MCLTLETACWLWLGCWSNNAANRHLRPGPLNCRVLHTCLVPQCPYPPHSPCNQWRLVNCDWMPVSYTSGEPSYSCRHPTSWALSQRMHIVSNMPFHGAWAPAPLRTHLSIECRCTVSQIETPICTHLTITHQFIWQ